MNLQERISLLLQLGKYIHNNTEELQFIKRIANKENPWFTLEFIDLALYNIETAFLSEEKLTEWTNSYSIPNEAKSSKTVGIVMAGNIPLVGFHDFLCAFISGHKQKIKFSSKDQILLRHFITKMKEWNPEFSSLVEISEMLKNCEAYIATGSNNAGRYFDYYFGKYPSIIRKNRTSVAVLTGNETSEQLDALVSDIQLYFGLGCRNITKIFVPKEYDFETFIKHLKTYERFLDFDKYKNNYDYQLAILLLNKEYYMSGGSLVLHEAESNFAPISLLNYAYYSDKSELLEKLSNDNEIQCIVSTENIPFGEAQKPSLKDYADGEDTLAFLLSL